MNRLITFLLFVTLLVGMVSLAYGLNYAYFTEYEHTRFDQLVRFMNGDTMSGPIRSNDSISIMGSPTFWDFVVTSKDIVQGTGFRPFFGYPLVRHAPEIHLLPSAQWVRDAAMATGYFYNTGDTVQTWALLSDHAVRFWTARVGEPIDSNVYVEWPLADSAVVFVNGPLDVSGEVGSILIMGAAGRIGLLDNLIYTSSRESDGRIVPGHPEKFALISENEIKIRNTVVNGRENSSGHGISDTDPSTSSIALNGIFVALNETFTFEQQNDADSGYVCECTPDDRGRIRLYGGMIMKRRNYFHRSSRASTGYLKDFHYDNDLRFWNLPIFDARENQVSPAALNLGEVARDETARDTVRVFNDFVPVRLDSVSIAAPFHAEGSRLMQFENAIPVSFTPTMYGTYQDTLRFYSSYYHQWFAVPVRGTCGMTGVGETSVLHPSSFILSASPNPFNPSTTFRFSLPEDGIARVELFDLLGRQAASIVDRFYSAGEYTVAFDGAKLSGGVYFARLWTSNRQATVKIALIK